MFWNGTTLTVNLMLVNVFFFRDFSNIQTADGKDAGFEGLCIQYPMSRFVDLLMDTFWVVPPSQDASGKWKVYRNPLLNM